MTATRRGHTGRGLGHVSYISPPPAIRGTTNQICGLYPFAVGTGATNIGVPLGKALGGGKTLGAGVTINGDPLNWFTRAKLISNPSFFILGMPGLGKSSLARRIIAGLAPTARPLIFADLKPDYSDLIAALGGQVIALGRGRGSLNILDPGQMDDAATRLGGRAGSVLREEGHGRRLGILRALLAVVRGRRTDDWEDTILSTALQLLTRRWTRHKNPPLLKDLIGLIETAPPEIRLVTLDRGSDERYRDAVDPLVRSLLALSRGALGDLFARPTTERIRLDAPGVCIDVSSISPSDTQLQSAVMLAGWNEGMGAVEAANALADAGREPQRNYLIDLDELWRPLRSGEGLVDRVDELTRLNRSYGVAQISITHTLADLRALDGKADREKARGFVERAGAVICFGLPPQELDDLNSVVRLSRRERANLTDWSTPPGWSSRQAPPGRGKCLIKVGARAGIALEVALVDAERELHNTSRRWGI